jgi:hypothetical protein
MTETNSHDREELRLLYTVTITDLSYFKTQQWLVANYCLLIDGGLIGVAQLIHNLNRCDRWWLAGLSIAAAVAAVIILCKLQRSIHIRHKRLSDIRTKFGAAFKAAWSAEQKKGEYMDVGWLLVGGVVVTMLLTAWLLLWRIGV